MKKNYSKEQIEILEQIKEYWNGGCPSSIKEYDANTPFGLQRSVLSRKYRLGIKDIKSYITSNDEVKWVSTAVIKAKAIGLQILNLEEVGHIISTETIYLDCLCLACGNIENIERASLVRRTTFGCKICNGLAPLTLREGEVTDNIKKLTKDLILELPNASNRKHITLKCAKCTNIYTREYYSAIRHNNICCTCMAPKMGNFGIRSIYNNIEFDSIFELEAYKILKEVITNIHVSYRDLGVPNCSYICDFILLNKLVVEVSSFNLNNHINYANKLDEKRALILTYTEYDFKFLNNKKDIEDIVRSLLKDKAE